MRVGTRPAHTRAVVPIVAVTQRSRAWLPRKALLALLAAIAVVMPIDPHVLRSKVEVFIELARQRLQLAHVKRGTVTQVG
ncbi:hypothetical protein BH11MYX1_BH11MYX1_01780 [soil metagenome]